ncbi:MAG: putative porin, partial [Acidiferrobacterales bacterium]|nr:putative porin [Acidiferrobacterales bacterium]
DLLLDVAVRGRFWSQLRSRTLHPQTGLLVIPEAGARIFGPSGTLDVVLQGGIRTATLFVVYENILSGTAVLVGNLLVPTYPLPERRLRFGIYWPIFN